MKMEFPLPDLMEYYYCDVSTLPHFYCLKNTWKGSRPVFKENTPTLSTSAGMIYTHIQHCWEAGRLYSTAVCVYRSSQQCCRASQHL